jgi:hypothetical protein
MKYDQVFYFDAMGILDPLSFWDLKREWTLVSSWAVIIGVLGLLTAMVGPGAAMAEMWRLREGW